MRIGELVVRVGRKRKRTAAKLDFPPNDSPGRMENEYWCQLDRLPKGKLLGIFILAFCFRILHNGCTYYQLVSRLSKWTFIVRISPSYVWQGET
jgi:hypothetical protein